MEQAPLFIDKVSFTVYGIPQPQGSMRAFIPKGWKRPVITAVSGKTKPWRQEVAGTALVARGSRNLWEEEAVVIHAHFYFDKPKSSRKKTQKTTKPDIDKLLRATLDALTGVLFRDDSQVVKCVVTKRFGSPARVEITIGAAMG